MGACLVYSRSSFTPGLGGGGVEFSVDVCISVIVSVGLGLQVTPPALGVH